MAIYLQADRPLTVHTPLKPDDLLIVSFHGREEISRLFEFRLDLLAENATDVPFEKLLGQKITVNLTLLNGKPRYFSGICKSVSEGTRDPTFTEYRMEVVPQLWLLGKRTQSRIFQQQSVPEILKKVLDGLDVVYEIEGTFPARDYCAQYRESDLNFAGRLMEEEGIFYYFRHSERGHTLVVSNTSRVHPELTEGDRIIYGASEQGLRGENRISSWEKRQELRSGKVALWDHCFELPHKHLDAEKSIAESVTAGTVAHKQHVAHNEHLELYDYPGAYAQRFDGVTPGGGDRSADLDKIFDDNKRTAAIRMQEETVPGLVIEGTSACRNFVSGSKFTLERHFNADGPYLLTSVEHKASLGDAYRSGKKEEFLYRNSFTCIPIDQPFRPLRLTPKPTVRGTQTAVVVGPPGEEIFTDKYGRVKVQFHWDRQGKNDGNSSCWVRVGTPWAGKGWGAVHIPRVGQEVVVDYLEGDPDQPLIIGSVYNADQMPPYPLPGSKMVSGVKSRSYPGGGGYNEFILNDTKGKELIQIHGQYDMDSTIEHDLREHVLNDRTRDVTNNETIQIGGNEAVSIVGKETRDVGKTLEVTAGTSITLKTGASSITMKADGTIEIKGVNLTLNGAAGVKLVSSPSELKVDPSGVNLKGLIVNAEAQVQMAVKGLITQITASAMLQTQGAITMMS